MKNAVIVQAKRTAIGAFMGSLSSIPASNMSSALMKDILLNTEIDPGLVDEVILGHVLQASCGQNSARQAAIHAGIPYQTPAFCLNQVCGSGLRAVIQAMQCIQLGYGRLIFAGGHENMSLSPHASYMRLGVRMGECVINDTMIQDGLWDVFNDYHMGCTAENLAQKYGISREEQDEFAEQSHKKAQYATRNGFFKNEITPFPLKVKKEEIVFEKDEHVRPNVTQESLAKLRPVFLKEKGTVTAGNSSGINDGAAILLIAEEKYAQKLGLEIIGRIVSYGQGGVDPAFMGIGPVSAVKIALERASWSIEDLDLIEANEAFAAQAISVNREIQWDTKKININGGAIALGHPIGASGARILVTLMHAMKRQNAKKGLATLCIGGGMGVCLCVDAF